MMPEDVLIIGAGPSGMAAAIQLKRSDIPFVLVERERVGGLLWNANWVENYPGFPNGVSGPKLARSFERHMRQLGIEVLFEEVTRLTSHEGEFLAQTAQRTYRPRFLICASGTLPIPAPLPVPAQARANIHNEVYPLLGVQGCRIAIIGAGDAAFDYSLNLSRHNQVTILIRGGEAKCLPLLARRASASDRIDVRFHTALTCIEVDEPGNTLRLVCQEDGNRLNLACDHLVFAIGRQPRLDYISPDLQAFTQVLVDRKRLYLVGDVANGFFRQTGIAVGDGLKAAMQIAAQLKREQSGED